MKYRLLAYIAVFTLVASAEAQTATADPLSTYLRRSYAALSRNLLAIVETMPSEEFGYRPPGAAKEVRTFGEIVAHVAFVSAFSCEMGDGKPAASKKADSAFTLDKDRLMALLKETDARCIAYLATVVDSALSQTITTTSAGRGVQAVRGNSIVFAIVHGNEHYGNLVTYLRAKGLVPPLFPAQAGFLSAAPPSKP